MILGTPKHCPKCKEICFKKPNYKGKELIGYLFYCPKCNYQEDVWKEKKENR